MATLEEKAIAPRGGRRGGGAARIDVAIVGAGPYGLSVAAFLRAAGFNVALFGETMGFWSEMPEGMRLRSPWAATHLADPSRAFSLDAYEAMLGHPIARPVPLETFVDYGRWFASHAVGDIDRRRVTSIEAGRSGFSLALSDGDTVDADRVVLALGISEYASRPPQLEGLPATLAMHSGAVTRPSDFGGRTVGIVGAGQSAVELAALFLENGAQPELLIRASGIRWLRRSARLHRLGSLSRLLYAPTDIGPAGASRVIALPALHRRFPGRTQHALTHLAIRPAAAAWLHERTEGVPVTTGVEIVRACPEANGLSLDLSDGTARRVDNLIFATGYSVDLRRHPLVDKTLADSIRMRDGYPVLDRGFETSLRGLHVVGAAAGHTFGPLMRFVAGVEFTAENLCRRAARRVAAV